MKIASNKDGKLDFEGGMNETHLNAILYDWYEFKSFILEPREELFIFSKITEKAIFHCAFHDRFKDTMQNSFKKYAHSPKEFYDIIGQYIIFNVQGIDILNKFLSNSIAYNDWKPANILVSFVGNRLKIGDFGITTQIFEYNILKGCTPEYCAPGVYEKYDDE